MTRVASFALLAAAVLSALSRADVAVAPPPREIRRDPAPVAETPKKEDPRAVVERIILNSKAVGEKLATHDTGTDTRKTQDRILKDIDALLNQDDPPKSDKDKQQDKNKDMSNDKDKQQDKDKEQPKDKDKQQPKDKDQEPKDKDMKGGMGDPPPPKMKDNEPMGGMGGMEPMGGDQPKERRPRQGDNSAKEEPKDPGMKEPGGGGSNQKKPDMKAGKPKDMKTGGKLPDPMGDKPQPPGIPLLPLEDDTPKEAWGHLPDKLRQQATQYYKQEFMPRYAELLKHYYSSDKK